MPEFVIPWQASPITSDVSLAMAGLSLSLPATVQQPRGAGGGGGGGTAAVAVAAAAGATAAGAAAGVAAGDALVACAGLGAGESACSSPSGETHCPCWQIRSPLHCMSYWQPAALTVDDHASAIEAANSRTGNFISPPFGG
uniref:Uncharacterized protein n=1 Tax=Cupriavidus pinatubonensis (strain JMP 134 / LMG 1197) TaxID=264198 RepID=Q472D9_CUPPJ